MSEGIESGPCQKVMFTDIINARVKSLDNQFLMIVNMIPGRTIKYMFFIKPKNTAVSQSFSSRATYNRNNQ